MGASDWDLNELVDALFLGHLVLVRPFAAGIGALIAENIAQYCVCSALFAGCA